MAFSRITIISLVVTGIILLLLILRIFFDRDKFDITVDPLRAKNYDYVTTNLAPYPMAKRNGLNTESNNNVDICAFNEKFNKETEFVENENMNACELTARQYCSVLYSNHQELFTNLYSGLGECEISEAENCKACPNKLRIKVD